MITPPDSVPLPSRPRHSRGKAVAPRLLFAAALLVTLLALFLAEENWRAARDWAACQRDLLARGERLDPAVAEPPILPPERSLACTPLLTDIWNYTADPRTGWGVFPRVRFEFEKSRLLDQMPRLSSTAHATHLPTVPSVFNDKGVDLADWQNYYRQHPQDTGLLPVPPGTPLPLPADDVLRAMNHFAPVLGATDRAAAAMPDGIFCTSMLDPGSVVLSARTIVSTLSLRASAHLATGQSSAARHDLELIFWLGRATASEPPLDLPVVIKASHLTAALAPLREGLATRHWIADDLLAIQQLLESQRLLHDCQRSLRGERAFCLGIVDQTLGGGYRSREFFGGGKGWHVGQFFPWLLTRAFNPWLVRNKVVISRYFQDYLIDSLEPDAHRLHAERLRAGDAAFGQRPSSLFRPGEYLASLVTSSVSPVIRRLADAQTAVDEGIVACALERFALDHDGSYPAALDELTPRYLSRVPPGIVDGAPMAYLRTASDGYQLSALLDQPGPANERKAVVNSRLLWSCGGK